MGTKKKKRKKYSREPISKPITKNDRNFGKGVIFALVAMVVATTFLVFKNMG